MQLIRGQHNFIQQLPSSVVTIGNFDGLHLGHQALINEVKAYAKEHQLKSAVVTFEPHPREFFTGKETVPRLMRLREKCIGLRNTNIDYVCCLQFNAQLAAMTPEVFVRDFLQQQLNAKHIIIGDDFRFGAKRAGDFHALVEFGKQYGFTVAATPTVEINDRRVSSSWVREALQADDLALVEKLLGRPYGMAGRVVHGDQLGSKLGFPTANLFLHRKLAPLEGVFVVRVRDREQRQFYGAASVGTRPSVSSKNTMLLEVFIFDFDEDIYGQAIQIEFLHKLRDQVRYDSLAELSAAIAEDVRNAKTFLK